MDKFTLLVAVLAAVVCVQARIHLYKEDNFRRGEGVTIHFTPKNASAQFGIALCKDALQIECYSLNLFGFKEGQLAYYFYRHGPNETTSAATTVVAIGSRNENANSDSDSDELLESVEELEEQIGTLFKEMLTPTVEKELAWVPGRRVKQLFTVLHNDWNMENFDEWAPLKRYVMRLLRTDEGEVRLQMAGLGAEQQAKLSFPISDEYKYLTFGTRRNQAVVKATRPRQLKKKP